MAGAVSTAELKRELSAERNQRRILQARFDKLAEMFCSYYLSEQITALGIVCNKQKQSDGREKADILVLSQHLTNPDLKRDKLSILTDSEPKTGKWRPLILSQESLSESMDLFAEEQEPDDTESRNNSALV